MIRTVITGLVVVAAIVGFFYLRDLIGPNAAVVSVLPVAVVSAYYGTKWGLLATSVAFPANVFLLDRTEGDLVSPFVSLSLLLVAWIFGQLHKLEAAQRADNLEQTERLHGLEAASERAREMLDVFPDAVFRITDTGRIMEMYGEHHLGVTGPREELLFRSLATVSEDWQSDLLKMARVAEEKGTVPTARHHMEIAGEARVVESRVAVLEGGDAIVVARVVEGAFLGPI